MHIGRFEQQLGQVWVLWGRVANVQYNAVKIYMEFRMDLFRIYGRGGSIWSIWERVLYLEHVGEDALFRILGEGALFRVFKRGCSI